MAFSEKYYRTNEPSEWTCLSTDTKETPSTNGKIKVTDIVYETDTGDKYEYRGSTAGYRFVKDSSPEGFAPAQDDIQDLTMDGTAQVIALSAGVKLGAGKVVIFNQGATTESIRYAFGTSSANAAANLTISAAAATTGILVPAYADYGLLCRTDPIRIPALATHLAVANAVAADTQAVQVIPGQ